MTKRMIFFTILLLGSLFSSLLLVFNQAKAAKLAKIYVAPVEQTASPGGYITAKVMVADVEDLFTVGLAVKWYGPALNVTDIQEGGFLNQEGLFDTFFVSTYYNGPDPAGEDANYLSIGITLKGKVYGRYGYGTLFNMTFLVESEAGSALDIYWSELMDSRGYYIRHSVEDGYVNIDPPLFSVVPESVVDETLTPGKTFNVTLAISNVVDLLGFKFRLGYNSTHINITEVSIVPFLTEPVIPWNTTRSLANETVEINYEASFVQFAMYSIKDPSEPVSGNGTLAQITFEVLSVGESILEIYDTEVADDIATTVKDHTPPAVDGYFSNMPTRHDISVKKVVVYPSEVFKGDLIEINVTIENLGGFDETFNATLYYDSTLINEKTNESIEGGEKVMLQFTWDTTDVNPGEYNIKAVANIAEDVDTQNNEYVVTSKVLVKGIGGFSTDLIYVAAGIAVAAAVVSIVFWRSRK